MAMKQSSVPKPRPRGFQCVPTDKLKRVCRKGGNVTAKRYGKEHMSTIGRNGRRKRALKERKAKREAAVQCCSKQ